MCGIDLGAHLRLAAFLSHIGTSSDMYPLVPFRLAPLTLLQFLKNPERCVLAQRSARNDDHTSILPSPLRYRRNYENRYCANRFLWERADTVSGAALPPKYPLFLARFPRALKCSAQCLVKTDGYTPSIRTVRTVRWLAIESDHARRRLQPRKRQFAPDAVRHGDSYVEIHRFPKRRVARKIGPSCAHVHGYAALLQLVPFSIRPAYVYRQFETQSRELTPLL
jgi:hypothetical protein